MPAVNLHGKGFRLEAVASAGLAGRGRHELLDLLAHPRGVRFAPAPLQVADHALESLARLVSAHAVIIGKLDFLLAGAAQNGVAPFLGDVAPAVGKLEAIVLAKCFKSLGVIGGGIGRFRPRRDCSAAQGERRVRYHHVRVYTLLGSKAVAGRAGTERIVEREQARFDLGNGEAGNRAGEFLREHDPLMGFVLRLVGAVGSSFRGRQWLVGELCNCQSI